MAVTAVAVIHKRTLSPFQYVPFHHGHRVRAITSGPRHGQRFIHDAAPAQCCHVPLSIRHL